MERLDRFMARANAAYYATHDPFADFTTAPEISQVFGEILGLWAAVTWEGMGRPAPVLMAEAGPGRGTLMRDALRAASRVAPAFHAALALHLVETSPRLRAEQARLLPQAQWHDRIEDIPPGPLLLLANEFLDALPIRQLVRRGGGWAERHVVGTNLVELPAEEPACAPASAQAKEGDIVEVCETSQEIALLLSDRIRNQGGAALFLDYGPERSAPGDSLQAIRDGKPADPLAEPGAADLTAHVDFQALAETARRHGAAVHGPLSQGLFLKRLGLMERTHALARTQPVQRAAALFAAAQRLGEPERMGRLFKALAICHPADPTPPGFES
jgi:NADH dehydrogenase [ubiquinone] 1 alpha subcomplex assembly factor 7